MSTPRTICAVDGCSRAVSMAPYSSLCIRHAQANNRNGNPLAKALTTREMNRYRESVARTLAAYLHSSAVESALLVAADILNFRPRHSFSWELKVQNHMHRLVNDGVQPRELLQRVCQIWALQHFEARFDDRRELEFALARAVLRLRPYPNSSWRPAGLLLRYLGRHLLEELSRFATGLCRRIETDDQRRAAAQQAFANGWQLDGETAD